MSYGIIINNKIQFEKFKCMENSTIFKLLLIKLSKYKNNIYILSSYKFYNSIKEQLNDINFLIKKNINILLFDSNFNNQEITFILCNLIKDKYVKIIPIDDFNFNKNYICNMVKSNIVINKGITWSNPIYYFDNLKYKVNFILSYKNNNLIEYSLKKEKLIIEYFFNQITNNYDHDEYKLNEIINRIKKYENYKLIIYNYN